MCKKIKQALFPTILLLIIFCFVISTLAFAATTATVTATVTAQNVSVTVSDGSVSYGTIATSETQNTTSTGVNDSQTATNNGNVTEDLNIKGQDTTNWVLGASAGSEQYFHKFCTSDCDSSPTWTALTTSYQTLASSVSASGNQEFDLQIGTPSSTSNYSQQSADITVQAVSS